MDFQKKKWSILIGIGIVIFLIALLVTYKKKKDDIIQIETISIKRGDISSSVVATGKIRSEKEIEMKAKILGNIKTINFNEGSIKKENDILLQFDDLDIRQEIDEWNLKLKEATMELEKIGDELGYTKELYKIEGVTSKKVREVERELQLKEEKVESIKKILNVIKLKREEYTIVAPFEGMIIFKPPNIQIGEKVSFHQTLCVLADIKKMIIEARISAEDVCPIKVGQEVKITLTENPNKGFWGKVIKIAPQVSEIEGIPIVVVWIKPSCPLPIKYGSKVEVEIFTSFHKDVLLLPPQAIIQENDKKIIKVIKEGKVFETEIETGIINPTYVEIIPRGKVSEGDEVILWPKR